MIGPQNQKTDGFSLLEIITVLGLMGLLASGIFGVTVSTFELSAELKEFQDRNQQRQRLVEILELNLLSLPASATIELETVQSGNAYETTLSLGQVPHAFQRSSDDRGTIEGVVMRTGKGRGGFVRVTIHYLDLEQFEKFERKDFSVLQSAPSLVLADRLKQFEWRFYDPSTEQWEEDWKDSSRRPARAELTLAHEGDKQRSQYVFWIPPRRSAEVANR